MFERGKAVRNLTADEVARGMRHDRILLVDVREPNETALEAFPRSIPRAFPIRKAKRWCSSAGPAKGR